MRYVLNSYISSATKTGRVAFRALFRILDLPSALFFGTALIAVVTSDSVTKGVIIGSRYSYLSISLRSTSSGIGKKVSARILAFSYS